MGLGFPLWLFTSIVLTAWVFFASGELVQDIGSLEYSSPTLSQMAMMKASILGFFLSYLAVFFFAHRITKHPWTVFASHAGTCIRFLLGNSRGIPHRLK